MKQKQKNKTNKWNVDRSAKQHMQKVEMYIPVFPEMRGMPDPKTSFTQVARNDSHFVLSFRAC